jgi:FAD/FMN-containing dehydrogenase
VYGIAKIETAEDVRKALVYAKAHGLKITSAGQRHSMGGQSFSAGGLVLDMRGLNHMSLDEKTNTLTVESGAKWSAVQEYLDARGLSVKAMQSINIFTVGGTLSVNAHGVAHDPGPIAPTVKALRVMLADGKIVEASPTKNADLFSHVLGGYGLFGVILEADLEVVPNEAYTWTTHYINYTDFPAFYRTQIEGNKNIGLMYSRLSMSPFSYLKETAVHVFEKNTRAEAMPPLVTSGHDWLNRLIVNFSKTGKFGKWVRWTLEKNIEPHIHNCISRNQAMSQPDEVCDVSRNQEMYDSMGYLKNKLADTDILQEYFIPQESMPKFVDGLKNIVNTNGANLLNCTIRIAHKDTITALPYAKEDMFAFVLYFNQKLNTADSQKLQKTTSDLIDLATSLSGTYYLPYQLYYSPAQLHAAYPEIDAFFAKKKQYDPDIVFTNKWYEKYAATPPKSN